MKNLTRLENLQQMEVILTMMKMMGNQKAIELFLEEWEKERIKKMEMQPKHF